MRSIAIAAVAVAVLALSACGSDSGDGETSEPAAGQGREDSDSDAQKEWVSGSPLTLVSVQEGEDSDTVILEFANAAPDYLGDGFVDRVARGGDHTDQSHDVDGDVYLLLRLTEQGAFETGEADEVLGTRTDGRIAHVFPHGQFEGLLNIAIGIESANGEEPDYDITTEENRMLIEISHSSR
ncbi:hypothetical protein [Streptomyces otsuchiensis]|uniref:hypothetical protein n=1 Tax=Streptomyces otsuchiensis TaxID=2681388 RepID=UPI00103025B3|nr:hypothetical protein [Streptomyces otsuchiensis]